jgi:hypothetical protein
MWQTTDKPLQVVTSLSGVIVQQMSLTNVQMGIEPCEDSTNEKRMTIFGR